MLVGGLAASLLTPHAAQADGELVLGCPVGWGWDGFGAHVPGSVDQVAEFDAVGSNGASYSANVSLDADPDTGAGDWYYGPLDGLRANGLTPPYAITVTDSETSQVIAEGSVGECEVPQAAGMWPPQFPASSNGSWATDLPSNDFMGWRHEVDGSLTAVAKDPYRWNRDTRHAEYVDPAPGEVSLGMPPGSEEQVRFDFFLCDSWGGDADGFWVYSAGPGVTDHVTLQFANRDAGWLDVAGSGSTTPEGFVWRAMPGPARYALPMAPGLAYFRVSPSDGPVSLRALDADGRVVGQRTYDNYCGVTFDPATYAVVEVPSPQLAADGSWDVPADSETFQWTLEIDGDLVVRLLPLLSTFPDGEITHNFGPATGTPDPAPTVDRTQGENRYGTAAALALANYTEGLDTVYLATGTAFPDALSGSALAGDEAAPILLTRGDSLPLETRAALESLSPSKVVVLGGENAVVDAVLQEVSELGPKVTRLAGGNRYETAAQVSSQFAPADAVFVASGLGFPDALAAAGAAGASGDPVLLTRKDALPRATIDELVRHAPSMVYLLGGPAAVSSSVEQEIEALGLAVTRVGGENRYGTAAGVAALLGSDGFSQAWVASGTEFADALSAGPLAGRDNGAILLTRRTALPNETAEALLGGSPGQITIMGGPDAVSTAVETQIANLPWAE